MSLRNFKKADEMAKILENSEWKRYSEKVKYAAVEIEGRRWILVDSEEKREYEERMRNTWIEKGAKELSDLEGRVIKGNLKDSKKIAYYLGSISKRYHIKRYFNYEIGEGKFNFYLDGEKLERERRYEGRYLLESNCEDLDEREIIREYENLWEVESAFREIKDFLRIRTIYHKTEMRVKAHIFIAVITYLIEKVIQKRLKFFNLRMRVQDVLEFANSIKIVEIELCDRKIKFITQKMNPVTRKIFDLLEIRLPRIFDKWYLKEFIKGSD